MTTNAPRTKQKHLKLPNRSPVPKPYDSNHLLSGNTNNHKEESFPKSTEYIGWYLESMIPDFQDKEAKKYFADHVKKFVDLSVRLTKLAKSGKDIDAFSETKEELQDCFDKIVQRLSTQFAYSYAKNQTNDLELSNTIFVETTNLLWKLPKR